MNVHDLLSEGLAKIFAIAVEYAFQVAKGYGLQTPAEYQVGVRIDRVSSAIMRAHFRVDTQRMTQHLVIPDFRNGGIAKAIRDQERFEGDVNRAAAELVFRYLDEHGRMAPLSWQITKKALERPIEELDHEACERTRRAVFRRETRDPST